MFNIILSSLFRLVYLCNLNTGWSINNSAIKNLNASTSVQSNGLIFWLIFFHTDNIKQWTIGLVYGEIVPL
jgi:hypothetical protein